MPNVRIARRAYFSSAVRLALPHLSREENIALFGSLYSDHGHGHNYILEAHISGAIDKSTGMLISMRELDDKLKSVTDLLDHRHLNHDIPRFRDVVPTTENVAIFCYEMLEKQLRGLEMKLEKIRLYENDEYWVDYGPGAAPEIS